MDKRTLCASTARKSKINQVDVHRVFNALVEVVQDALVHNERVILYGLGVFKVIPIRQHMARNPKTGEPHPIKATRRVKFTAVKGLRRF